MSELSLTTGSATVSAYRTRTIALQPTIIAALVYLSLVSLMWGMFAFNSGMSGETAFAYMSETSSIWRGFIYPGDSLRPNTNTFYHLAYLLGEIVYPGSFAPYQFVYATLWFARGLLVFLILKPIRYACALLLSAVIVYYGAGTAVQLGGMFRLNWETHRQAVAGLLRVVPQVVPGTILVLTNVPKQHDPLGDDYWFDMALRLAYSGTAVSGLYFFDDGTPGTGNNLTMIDGQWRWNDKAFAPLVNSGSLEQTVVVRYGASGLDRLVEQFPDSLCSRACAPDEYSPRARIAGSAPSLRAIHRYGPL